MKDVQFHPKYGLSWEGFALEQVLAKFGEKNAYFWKTQRGAELDLMLMHAGNRLGFEFKCQDAPTLTPSMTIALSDLQLDHLYVVYPGQREYELKENIVALPLQSLQTSPHLT